MARTSPAEALARLRDLLDRLAPDPGDRLPTERDLGRRLGCSRQTLRAALLALEEEGEVWRKVGKGTFRGRAPLGHPVRETILLQAASPTQLIQARLLIEPVIAEEAARRASSSDVRYLAGLAAAGRQVTTRHAAEAADARFHRGVSEVAANPILIGLLDYLADARRRAAWQRQWERTYRMIGVSEFTALHSDQHDGVIEAISRGDPATAGVAMRGHLETIAAAMRTEGAGR